MALGKELGYAGAELRELVSKQVEVEGKKQLRSMNEKKGA